MMMDWNAYTTEIRDAVREMSAATPEMVKAYAGLHHANSKSQHLDAKTRELIGMAVAVALRCDGCINAHTEAAVKAGVTKEEMMEALGVAIMIGAGAAMVYSARSIDAFNAHAS